MLISWIVLAIGQVSAPNLPLIDVATGVSRPAVPSITPGEPSTFVEALIGVALIAAYLVFTRGSRGRQNVQRIAKPTSAGSRRKAA